MAVKIALSHKTYTLTDLLPYIRMFLDCDQQHIREQPEGYTFKISPENHFINWQQDPLEITSALFFRKIKELTVEVEVIAKCK
jgi:hypothetical protein